MKTVRCIQDRRGILISNPPQYQCGRCSGYWYCHEEVPICTGKVHEAKDLL